MKNKIYLLLYYLCFIMTFIFIGIAASNISFALMAENEPITYNIIESIYNYLSETKLIILAIFNFILFIIFTIKIIKKKKLNNIRLVMPISYIIFSIIILVICFMFNQKVIYPYIHFGYYLTFIYIAYLILNIYSILCLTKKD